MRFIELNAVSARLIGLLQGGDLSAADAMHVLARELQHPDPAALLLHGRTLLDDLRRQGAILGVRRVV